MGNQALAINFLSCFNYKPSYAAIEKSANFWMKYLNAILRYSFESFMKVLLLPFCEFFVFHSEIVIPSLQIQRLPSLDDMSMHVILISIHAVKEGISA